MGDERNVVAVECGEYSVGEFVDVRTDQRRGRDRGTEGGVVEVDEEFLDGAPRLEL